MYRNPRRGRYQRVVVMMVEVKEGERRRGD